MGKIVLFLILTITMYASSLFESKCMPCHQKKHLSLKAIYFNYILYHSSKRLTLQAMQEYLIHPDPKKSMLPYNLKKYNKGIYKHNFDQKTLKKALEEYWTRYTVIGKIR